MERVAATMIKIFRKTVSFINSVNFMSLFPLFCENLEFFFPFFYWKISFGVAFALAVLNDTSSCHSKRYWEWNKIETSTNRFVTACDLWALDSKNWMEITRKERTNENLLKKIKSLKHAPITMYLHKSNCIVYYIRQCERLFSSFSWSPFLFFFFFFFH